MNGVSFCQTGMIERCGDEMTADRSQGTHEELERLDALLLAHGGDVQRWPEESQSWVRDFAARDPDARRMLDEARALDRLLDSAQNDSPTPHDALVDRIVGAAARQPNVQQDAQVIPFSTARREAAAKPVRPLRRSATATVLQAAAVLVTALALGVVLGASEFGRPTVRSIVVAAGMADLQEGEYGLLDGSPLSPSDEELQ